MFSAEEGNLSEQESEALHEPQTSSSYFKAPTENQKEASHNASMVRLDSQGNLSKNSMILYTYQTKFV